MGSTSFPATERQEHTVRIKYDVAAGHYMIDTQYRSCGPVLVLDGFEANKILELYLFEFFHNVEHIKRDERKQEKKDT